MNFFPRRRPLVASILVTCVLPLPVTGPQADEPAGDLWEVVSQMTLEGMNFGMPAMTMQVCSAQEWTHPPGGSDPDRGCTSSDVDVDGDSVTWVSSCADGTTGTGTITREGDDAYHGEIRYTSDDGDIVIRLTGHRIGTCDHPQ